MEQKPATVLSPNSGEPDFPDWLHEAPAASRSFDPSGARVKKLSGTHVDSFWLFSLMDQPFLRTTKVDTLLAEQMCETLFRDLCLALDDSPAWGNPSAGRFASQYPFGLAHYPDETSSGLLSLTRLTQK